MDVSVLYATKKKPSFFSHIKILTERMGTNLLRSLSALWDRVTQPVRVAFFSGQLAGMNGEKKRKTPAFLCNPAALCFVDLDLPLPPGQ